MSQTYAAFKKLAIGLDISVPQLFTPPQHTQIMGCLPMTKSGQGPQKPTVTYEHKLLAKTDDALLRTDSRPLCGRV